jgi:pullulanase/glycogen debranching enzyme
MRNLLATLMLSQGMPMICARDEFGPTQNGNNNAYRHDNGIAVSTGTWTGPTDASQVRPPSDPSISSLAGASPVPFFHRRN